MPVDPRPRDQAQRRGADHRARREGGRRGHDGARDDDIVVGHRPRARAGRRCLTRSPIPTGRRQPPDRRSVRDGAALGEHPRGAHPAAGLRRRARPRACRRTARPPSSSTGRRTTPTCSATASPATATAGSTTPPRTRSRSASPRSRRTASITRSRRSRSRRGWRRSPRSSSRCARPVRMSSCRPRCTAEPTGWSQHVLARFGVESTFVDMTDLDAVRAAMRDNTAMVWAETIANPTTAVTDIPGVASICRDAGVPFCVDSTFAPPPVCRPLRWGADLVVHSATKYLGGHSDVTGGAVVGDVGARLAGARGADRPRRQPRSGRGVPAASRARRPCRCGSSGTARTRSRSLRRWSTTRRSSGSTIPGSPSTRSTRSPASCSTAARAGSGTARSSRSRRAAGGPPGSASPTACRSGWSRPASAARTPWSATSRRPPTASSTTPRCWLAGISPGAVRFSIGLEDADDLIADITPSARRAPGG